MCIRDSTRHVDQRIIAVIDADPAGRAWGDHLSDLLETRGTVLDIVEPPNDLDLNTWARLDPGWMNALRSDVHLSRSRSDLMPSSTARSVHDVLDD